MKPTFPIPASVREMVYQLPLRYKALRDHWNARIHFILTGSEGGEFTVVVENDEVTVSDGLHGRPTLTLKGSAKTYFDIEMGNTSPKMAFFLGKVSVSSLTEMGKVDDHFYRVYEGR